MMMKLPRDSRTNIVDRGYSHDGNGKITTYGKEFTYGENITKQEAIDKAQQFAAQHLRKLQADAGRALTPRECLRGALEGPPPAGANSYSRSNAPSPDAWKQNIYTQRIKEVQQTSKYKLSDVEKRSRIKLYKQLEAEEQAKIDARLAAEVEQEKEKQKPSEAERERQALERGLNAAHGVNND